MSARLIYVMGPSGAGKDSVLGWLRERAPASIPLRWARRTITRPADAGGEQHEAVTPQRFDDLLAADAFAMAWRANGHGYGIRHAELQGLGEGAFVLVNGSRQYLHEALTRYPRATGLYITAQPATLADRLRQRKRETASEIQARVARALHFTPPPGVIVVHNDTTLEEAGAATWQALSRMAGWPAAELSTPHSGQGAATGRREGQGD
ncbi:MAG TPA: phosphonate metabolism protein/1,5-bisphosphokinase (PRPP-forming) PhnN [Ramlibacter sp.]|nr:phosphonate metabolism protein/1,5-bisphosphokinase (PRPP-forming) PhnN [Ramlibacter sp.]